MMSKVHQRLVVEYEFFLFDGAGHTSPGTGNKAGSNSVNMDIDGVTEIYNFFKKNVLNP